MNKQAAYNRGAALLAAAILGGGAGAAAGQSGTPRLTDSLARSGNPLGVQWQKLAYLDKDGTPNQPGQTFSETLRGNGTRAGYLLSHGGVIPSSLRVSAGARSLRQNADYFLDAANGALWFAEPIRRRESVRVAYRYVEGQDGQRTPTGLPGLALNFRGASLNLSYGLSSGGGSGLDFTTYGLSMSSRFGKGSTLKSLLYFSTPSTSNDNQAEETRASLQAPTQKADPKSARSDRLIVQDLNLQAGAASFRATYQDVGQNFNGFQAMRLANARDAGVMAQLDALEKEKGIRRLGFGAGLKTGKSDGFDLDWDRINDRKDQILRQSFGYTSGALNLTYRTQSVGEKFERFKDLRENEQAQWAREKGVKRSDLTLGFAAGKGSLLGFSQSSVGDRSGRLARESLNFNSKVLNFALTSRRADEKFVRLNDLSDAEKTDLALDIRRQFNPAATAAEVTPKDKEQIASDAGLSRSRMRLSTALGKQSAFAYNQFDIGDGKGSIRRQTLNLSVGTLSFHYLDQTISETFERLGGMSDFERFQFANEKGIRRSALGLNLALNKTSAFTFSQWGVNDKESGLSRQSFAYNAKGIDLRYNLANTDKKFGRVADLAMTPAEKQAIEAERGYRRADYTAHVAAIKGLTLDSTRYDARNAEEKREKSSFRHNLDWLLNKNTHLAYLTEGSAFALEGKAQEARAHTLLTLDQQFKRGMKFNYYQDTLADIAGGKEKPAVTTEFMHFETDRARPNSLLWEQKKMDLGDRKFENTTQYDLNLRASKTLTLRFNRLELDRGEDPSSDTDTVQWNWQINRRLNFTGQLAETHTNDETDVSTRSFGANGEVVKNLTIAGTYTQIEQQIKTGPKEKAAPKDAKGKKEKKDAANIKTVVDVAVSNARPISLLGLKNVTFTGKWASLDDRKKQQSEALTGRIQGFVGRHQFAAEYFGFLDPKGNAGITRIFTLLTDPNPKLALHLDILYKARNIQREKVQLVRKYNASLKLDRTTSVTYAYTSLPEDAAGNLQPLKSQTFALKRPLSKTLNLSVDYTKAQNLAQKTQTSRLSALVNDKLPGLGTVEIGYGVDLDSKNATARDAHTVRLGYDHQIDGDHFLTLAAAYTMFKGGQPNEIQANLDFKTRF